MICKRMMIYNFNNLRIYYVERMFVFVDNISYKRSFCNKNNYYVYISIFMTNTKNEI